MLRKRKMTGWKGLVLNGFKAIVHHNHVWCLIYDWLRMRTKEVESVTFLLSLSLYGLWQMNGPMLNYVLFLLSSQWKWQSFLKKDRTPVYCENDRTNKELETVS
ncbi:hypothetical protein VNO78_05777 [Psophocarpus tetragonolobus]|uniref:Uncharacterized protein n=1 Tax=Psophocarpus tetragonolobus TaxID=3891 RepID=A0AAN9SUA7_PSOTE